MVLKQFSLSTVYLPSTGDSVDYLANAGLAKQAQVLAALAAARLCAFLALLLGMDGDPVLGLKLDRLGLELIEIARVAVVVECVDLLALLRELQKQDPWIPSLMSPYDNPSVCARVATIAHNKHTISTAIRL